MIPYYLLYIVPIFTYYIESKMSIYQKKTKNITISVFFLMFIIMLALRNVSCGVDLSNYKMYFDSAHRLSWQDLFQDIEPGYCVLEKLVSYLTQDFNVFLAIVAIICLLPIWIFRNAIFSR